MRRFMALITLLFALAPAVTAPAATPLRRSQAVAALRTALRREFAITHASVSCPQRRGSGFQCRWSGRRPDGRYAGGAYVRRVQGIIAAQLEGVHRVR